MEKITKRFSPNEVLKSADLNGMVDKTNEIVDVVNTHKVVQTTGQSTTDVMSQKAVTDLMMSNRFYGVEKLRSATDPAMTPIGDATLAGANPILRKFRLAKVKDGKPVGFFKDNDLLKMEDGSPSKVIFGGSVKDDGTDVILVNTEGLYAILGGEGEKEVYAVSDTLFMYEGQIAKYIPPFGITPDFTIVKNGMQRCIRDNDFAGTKGAGSLGIAMFNENGYPTTATSRFGYEAAARKKNADTNSNIPYAATFHFDMQVWKTLMFIEFGTKDYHSQKHCGGALSSNDGTISAETWGKKTGMRTRPSADAPWEYKNIDWGRWTAINGNKPLLKMLDTQLALSHAKEKGIAENVTFDYDNAKYSYANIATAKSTSDTELTAIVTKYITSADGNTELCLTQPLVRGSVLFYGNIWRYVSGLEVILDNDTNKAKVYYTEDVTKMMTDSASAEINPTEKFALEDVYDLAGTRNIVSGYSAHDYENAYFCKENGASLHEGECHYSYMSKGTDGKRTRRAVRFGASVDVADASFGCSHSAASPSRAHFNIGGGFRVSLT